ncbi:hypothetical protein MBLNU459_g1205t1 [Dothideomycetes sp. NU459]
MAILGSWAAYGQVSDDRQKRCGQALELVQIQHSPEDVERVRQGQGGDININMQRPGSKLDAKAELQQEQAASPPHRAPLASVVGVSLSSPLALFPAANNHHHLAVDVVAVSE